MYKYETHLHTKPASACSRATVRESLECYKNLGYDGVFITNHFLDGNIGIDKSRPYEEKIEFYFADYEEGLKIGKELGIKVFLGAELSYGGTDFLVYGLDKEWFLKNPQIMEMQKSEELTFMRKNGALVIQAHPYRKAEYIDHIRLYPEHIDGVEIINIRRPEFENKMAMIFADQYKLLKTAGTDNHDGANQKRFAGLFSETPLVDERDFINRVRNGEMNIFCF